MSDSPDFPGSPESPGSPGDGAVGPDVEAGVEAGAEASAPRADGLDLARALMRATAKAPAAKATPKRGGRGGMPRKGRVSGARPDDRDPQLLENIVGRLVDDHGWDLSLRVHGVFGRWEELVGAEIAQHCTPESFADGNLVVRTDATAWATQLRLLAPTLVRRLNEELGHGTVLKIDVQGPHGPTWKKGPRSIRGARGPRDTYG